jgi:hypothetical protein
MLSDSSRSSRHCSVSFHRLLEQMHYTSAHLYSFYAYSRILTHIHACTLQNCATLACDMEPLAVAAASTDLTSARLQPGGCHFGRLTPIHASSRPCQRLPKRIQTVCTSAVTSMGHNA